MAPDASAPLRPAPAKPLPVKPRQPVQPPPMREVTKGWFTLREEAKTVEQFRQADLQRK